MERDKIMQDVQMYEFALVELILYLDTHPDDQVALSYYHQYKQLHDIAAKEYTSRFGPITPYDVTNTKTWDWVADPWPWQM